MTLAELQELEARWVMQTYPRAPVQFVRGEGARLWDSEGRQYLDFLAGIFNWPEAVRSLSVYHLYGRPMLEGLAWGTVAAFVVAILLLGGGSLAGFNRRDA